MTSSEQGFTCRIRCQWLCIGIDCLIHPALKSIYQLPRSKFHTDTAAIRRAARISLGDQSCSSSTPQMWYQLLDHTVLELTRTPTIVNSTLPSYTAPPPINRLLHRDWRNASKVSSGGCDRTGWSWTQTRLNYSCGSGPSNSIASANASFSKLQTSFETRSTAVT